MASGTGLEANERWRRMWPAASGVLLVGWVALVFVFVPAMIVLGYYGLNVEALNQAFVGRSDHSVWHYLEKWARSTIVPTVVLLIWLVVLPRLSGVSFHRRVIPPATPGELGAIRALVGLIILMNLLWERLPEAALFPTRMHHLNTDGLLAGLYLFGYDRVVQSATALGVLQGLGIAAAFLATIGLFTRFSVAATAILGLVIGATVRGYCTLFHTGVVPVMLFAFLAFTRCGDGFSVDRLIRRARGRPVVANRPAAVYGYGRWIAWAIVAVTYTMAGLSKLRNGGWYWWDGDNLLHGILRDNLTPMEFDFDGGLFMLHWPVIVFAMMGLSALIVETCFVLVLFNRTLRWVLPLSILGMHIGILFVQNILFFDLIILQAIFLPWRTIRRRAAIWLRRRRPRVSRPRTAPRRAVTAPRPFHPLLYACTLMAALTFLLAPWWLRLEAYPFTAMQMYSEYMVGKPIEYSVPYWVHPDGSRSVADFSEVNHALAGARARAVVWEAFEEHDPELIEMWHEFALVMGRLYNRDAPADRRAVAIEVEYRIWDYMGHRDDPEFGLLHRTARVDLPDPDGVAETAGR